MHTRGTVWDESCTASRSSDGHTRAATSVFEEALGYFPSEFFRGAEQLVDDAMRELSVVDLGVFRDYREFTRRDGAPESYSGPDLLALWNKSPMHASVAHQHRATQSVLAAPNLLDWGLAPKEHEAQAKRLTHPFAGSPPVDHFSSLSSLLSFPPLFPLLPPSSYLLKIRRGRQRIRGGGRGE